MPWTFAHIAAVIPIARIKKITLPFAGLAIGSMIPDLNYYLYVNHQADYEHTILGIFHHGFCF